MPNATGMVESANADAEPKDCSTPNCPRKIPQFERYFFDAIFDKTYCNQCGLCLRYARKKAIQRGEPADSARGDK
jgi:Pyruvate/2-oxoacid:ferredoxin oxidoreductase delta subunit